MYACAVDLNGRVVSSWFAHYVAPIGSRLQAHRACYNSMKWLRYIYFVFCTLCLSGNFPMGKSGRFPQGKPAAAESRFPTLINYKVHAGSFSVSIIHRTLTWTTGSWTWVRDHSCACVYARGLGTPTASQHTIFDSEKLTIFPYAPDGIRTSVLCRGPPRWPCG